MYAVTNHLFPKEEFFDRLISGFASDRGPAITDKWNATRFELRGPLSGNEFISTSVWESADAFDAWRNSQDIQVSHSNVNYEMYSRRAMLSFHDVLMNAEPGRAPVAGKPARYRRIGVGAFESLIYFSPKPEHAEDVIKALEAEGAPTAPGLLWWEVWKDVKGNRWWNITYWESREAYEAAKAAGVPQLSLPGDPNWYEGQPEEALYIMELERLPGFTKTERREVVARA
ncbi:MAG: antibiotic biosynthesis monooxygenase [Chloroflexota bacterium]|nr:antibiotic biosynthesis monooxygenase [Dehalococcoidia bacterium]MDW8253014.1 antibiotic biosynthesis monooxygenase [Chloroflexota bacterium]